MKSIIFIISLFIINLSVIAQQQNVWNYVFPLLLGANPVPAVADVTLKIPRQWQPKPYTYNIGEIVKYNNEWYWVKNKTAPNQTPIAYPMLYEKFPQGAQGIQGIQGLKGATGEVDYNSAAFKAAVKAYLNSGEIEDIKIKKSLTITGE